MRDITRPDIAIPRPLNLFESDTTPNTNAGKIKIAKTPINVSASHAESSNQTTMENIPNIRDAMEVQPDELLVLSLESFDPPKT